MVTISHSSADEPEQSWQDSPQWSGSSSQTQMLAGPDRKATAKDAAKRLVVFLKTFLMTRINFIYRQFDGCDAAGFRMLSNVALLRQLRKAVCGGLAVPAFDNLALAVMNVVL